MTDWRATYPSPEQEKWRARHAEEIWRARHRRIQRALCELEGMPYEEPKPRYVQFTIKGEERTGLLCTFCDRLFRTEGWRDRHEREVHGTR